MTDAFTRLAASLADRYRIERQLGEGGMASVYLAEDVKHNRKVAIKVLKPELAAVLGAERFVREIQTTAQLQHQHILPLFDSGSAGGFLYYVMPYVEGETLRDKLDRERQLAIDEAVRITTDVAGALDYAHRQGVIHRDIKPENILLHDGRPMVADFGIALAVSTAAGGRMTETGLSLGTPLYMSPEQASAEKELTGRADVYSLGAVLYEMLTGQPPHPGDSAARVIAGILTEAPRPVTELRRSTPPNVVASVAKALETLPADRFAGPDAFAAALADPHFVGGAAAAGDAPSPRAFFHPRWAWLFVGLGLGAGATWVLRPPPPSEEGPVTRFSIPVPEGHKMESWIPNLALSPDGGTVAYLAGGVLYERMLDQSHRAALARGLAGACCVRFTPDGQWIAFKTPEGERGVGISGGPVVDFSDRTAGVDVVQEVFEGPIYRRAAGDTTWQQVTELAPDGSEGGHAWPQLLGGGRLLLFTVVPPGMMWSGARVVLQDLETGERVTIANDATFGHYVPTGHVVYVRADGTVEAVRVDLKGRRVVGRPFVVQDSVRTEYFGGAASMAISDNGTFVFVKGSTWRNEWLTWVDREGRVLGRVGDPATVEGIFLSPDDRHAVSFVASPNADIWQFDVSTGERRRVTVDPKAEDNPIWSPDGRTLAYRRLVGGHDNRILAQSVDDPRDVRELYASEDFVGPRSWSPDGKAMALYGGGMLLVVDLESRAVDTITTRAAEEGGRFSPGGRWLAYTSGETGRKEVYVVSYPGEAVKHQISLNGGSLPEWSPAGGELFFINGDTLFVSRVSTTDRFTWSEPRPLFVNPGLQEVIVGYGVTSDAKRFLFPFPNPDAPAHEINVVLNWFQTLAESR